MSSHGADTKKIKQIYDYLSAPSLPYESAGVLAFGRKDLLIARKIVDLSHQKFADFVVITGGTGKDSGDLKIPEAEYLARETEALAQSTSVVLPPLFTETQSTNGAENVRNSLLLMRRAQLPHENALITVAHATSMRRLRAGVEHEFVTNGQVAPQLYSVPTNYDFDPSNPVDQNEAVAEMLRLADWPSKGWLQTQLDMPPNLVDFARDFDTNHN